MSPGEIQGRPALAQNAGKVVSAGYQKGFGNRVQVDHGNGFVSGYGHLDSIGVKVGDKVRAGQPIGEVGNTGVSTGAHLHSDLMKDGKYVNPADYDFTQSKVAKRVDTVAAAPRLANVATAKTIRGGLLDGVASAPPKGLLGPATAKVAPTAAQTAKVASATAARSLSVGGPAPSTVAKNATVTPNAPSARVASAATSARIANNSTPVKGMDVTGGLAERGHRVTGVAATTQSRPLSQAQATNLAGRLDLSTPKPAMGGLLSPVTSPTPVRATATPAKVTGGILSANVPTGGLLSAAVKTAPTSLSPISNAPKALSPVPTRPTTIVGRDVTAQAMSYGPQRGG